MIEDNETRGPHSAMPVFGRFAWMFFMQPITLHHRLRECGVVHDGLLWKLIQKSRAGHDNTTTYLHQLSFVLLLLMPILTIGLSGLAALAGLEVDWSTVGFGAGFGIAVGVALGVALGVDIGIPFGVASGAAVALANGVADAVTDANALEVVVGIAGGVGFGFGVGVSFGVSFGVAIGAIMGAAITFGISVAFWAAVEFRVGVTVGFGVGVAVGTLRLCAWPIEFVGWVAGIGISRLGWLSSPLKALPFRFHELSYLPFPGVRTTMVEAAAREPDELARALQQASRAPGQRGTVARVIAELWARDLQGFAESENWESAAQLQSRWLPNEATAPGCLLHFRDVGRHARAAVKARSVSKQVEWWTEALATLDPKNLPAPKPKDRLEMAFVRYHLEAVTKPWQRVLERNLQAARTKSEGLLPNPFNYSSNPLDPDQDQAVFRGRESSISELQSLLTHPGTALAVIGPRRTGKSSLLRMLPVLVPSDLFVYVDLQDNPVDNPSRFYQALDTRLSQAVHQERTLDLPRLGSRSTPEGVAEWLQELDTAATRHRIVFCIDEYERLDKLWPGDERSLLQFLGLMRATIQHRKRVRILLAGAASPEDLGALWTDHFLGVQEVRLDFLNQHQSIGLITKPEPRFPDAAVPTEIAEEIFKATAGQPYLLQLFGFFLVDRLNQEERKVATQEDFTEVARTVLKSAKNYFAEAHQAGPTDVGRSLDQLALDQTPEWTGATRRWMRKRGLIDQSNQIRVPLFKQWLNQRLADEQ